MENNKICNWVLHYSIQNLKITNPDNIIDVESSVSTKHKLCSAAAYFECGKVLFEDFPDSSTGFVGIFDYFYHNKANVMDKLLDEEQRLYINKLTNIDNFAMRHHVAIIKCLMKIYVCQLAPCERIYQALQAIHLSGLMDNRTNQVTFRHIQRCLIIWLRGAAIVGLLGLPNSSKNVTESQAKSIIDGSPVGSLILYAMIPYDLMKLVKYTVKIPDVDSIVSSVPSNSDLWMDQCRTVVSMFTDICDNKDVLPLHMDSLLSRSLDNVPTTLTIALIFHWIIGNSLKKFGDLFQMSTIKSHSDRNSSHRICNISMNNNSNDTIELTRPFFINNTKPPNDGPHQLFKGKDDRGRVNINRCLKSSLDGDTSSEVCLTPTDEEMPGQSVIAANQPIRLRPHNLSNNNNMMVEPMNFSLKAEFQKKLKEKQDLIKLSSRSSGATGNETTWLAQSTKAEVTPISLMPKKIMKSCDVIYSPNSPQNLSKMQVNQIQLQLSLQRQKIGNNKKTDTAKTDKDLEDSKQKAFFRALDRDKKLIHRRSMEIGDGKSSTEKSDADKRLSMYIKRTSENVVVSPIRRLGSREMLQSLSDEKNNNLVDQAYSSQTSESVLISEHQCFDPTNEIHNTGTVELTSTFGNDATNQMLPNEPSGNLSRKNSSPSMSSLSSFSNRSSEKDLVTKEDCNKSFALFNTCVTSLQQDILLLKQAQPYLNSQMPPSEASIDKIKPKSENNSVAETPTNNGMSLTEITDLPKQVVCISTENISDQVGSIKEIPDNGLDPLRCISQNGHTASPGKCDQYGDAEDLLNESEPASCKLDGNGVLVVSMTGSTTEDGMVSSSEMIQDPSVPPVSFVVIDEDCHFDVLGKKANLLDKGEERRALKMEQFKHKRDQDRENKVNAANDELLERESKKVHVVDDSPNQLPHDSKPVSVVAKPLKKAPTTKSNVRNIKQESVDNLSLASPRKNNGFPPIRQGQRITSSSTSKLNGPVTQTANAGSTIHEYVGPKLFAKTKIKTNRTVIINAISYCCLAGSVNVPARDSTLKDLADTEGAHFVILFRDSRCQYKSLYLFDLTTEELVFVCGNGPKKITHEMVEKFFKYNSGTKQFNAISSTTHLSTAVDAICIQSNHWNTRPTSTVLTGAQSAINIISKSTTNISQMKSKR